MKKSKMSLKELKIQSFVTDAERIEADTIKGGNLTGFVQCLSIVQHTCGGCGSGSGGSGTGPILML